MNEEVTAKYKELQKLPQKAFAIEANKYDKYIQTMLFALKNNFKQHHGKLEYLMKPKNFYNFISTYEGLKIKE